MNKAGLPQNDSHAGHFHVCFKSSAATRGARLSIRCQCILWRPTRLGFDVSSFGFHKIHTMAIYTTRMSNKHVDQNPDLVVHI